MKEGKLKLSRLIGVFLSVAGLMQQAYAGTGPAGSMSLGGGGPDLNFGTLSVPRDRPVAENVGELQDRTVTVMINNQNSGSQEIVYFQPNQSGEDADNGKLMRVAPGFGMRAWWGSFSLFPWTKKECSHWADDACPIGSGAPLSKTSQTLPLHFQLQTTGETTGSASTVPIRLLMGTIFSRGANNQYDDLGPRIQIYAEVTPILETCSVNSPIVDFGRLTPDDVNNHSSKTQKSFSLQLSSCVTGLQVSMMLTDAQSASNATTQLTNSDGAKGVAVQVLQGSPPTPITLGTSLDLGKATGPEKDIPLVARIVPNGIGAVGMGEINSQATIIMKYQ